MSEFTKPNILAIDGGGTKCRATLLDHEDNILVRANTGKANIATDFNIASQNIKEAIHLVYRNSGFPLERMSRDVAALAIAGSESIDHVQMLKQSLNFSKILIRSDCEAAVEGALVGENGILASIGTGSFFVSQIDGIQSRIGGWGFFLSDQCSGAVLGQTLLKQVVNVYDGLERESLLTEEIFSKFNNNIRDLVTFSLEASQSDYAALAPFLIKALEDNDAIAIKIMQGSTKTLCKILDTLDPLGKQPLCFTGGLGTIHQKLLPNHFQKRIFEPKGGVIEGIIRLAKKEFSI